MGRRIVVLIVALLLIICSSARAHSGRTDSQGGHYNHSTGEYHFHHGYPEHQHPDGVCPYAASAKATAKPSTGSSRSSTVKTSSSVAASMQSIKKEMNIMFTEPIVTLALMGIFIVMTMYYFAAQGKTKARKALHKSETELAEACLECNRLKSELVEKNEKVRRLTESCTNASNAYVSATKELQASDNTIRGLRDLVVAASDQCNTLQRQLDELGQQYNDLYSVWSDSQLVGYENPAVISEAMVYVNDSGIYHTRVHGNWREYKLMPLREALALRYRPCSICVPYDRPKF